MISVVRSIQYHYAGCPAHCTLKNNLRAKQPNSMCSWLRAAGMPFGAVP